MNLSPNLKAVIVQSFIAGQGLHFMADLYKQPYQKVEDVIRQAIRRAMIEGEKKEKTDG